jgi:hypothetical protein
METLLGSALKILVGSDVTVENNNGCQHKYENSEINMQFVFQIFIKRGEADMSLI